MDKKLKHLFEKYDIPLKIAHFECDGATLIISEILKRESIGHSIASGELYGHNPDKKGAYIIHVWIILDTGEWVDFKARMWMGDDAPNGVFFPSPETLKYYSKSIVITPPNHNSDNELLFFLWGKGLF